MKAILMTMLLVFTQATAVHAFSRHESCVDYSWERMKKYFGEESYLTAYGYARAALVCSSKTTYSTAGAHGEFQDHVLNIMKKLRRAVRTGEKPTFGISAGASSNSMFRDPPQ